MDLKEDLKKALETLRAEKQRKFDQSVDLIVNLQKFNIKKDSVNVFVNIPHKIKEKKIAGFLEVKNSHVFTITLNDFKDYNDKKNLKKLVKGYDFFIGQSSLMPKVATVFGKALGPASKMPSPQLGILMNVDDKSIIELKNKINGNIRIKSKESSIKLLIAKQSMKDEAIIDNILTVYNAILKALPREKDNVKNLEIKFSMTKPVKIKVR